ncbi:MAG: M48 family metalloprotease [Nitrososphaerota archaeon]|nr:M48 family metalloprotease [Nitrososphaerota archaeon]MDG7023762.1 M48 family metalloprotease [Nitrososphaerota archaeon]
MATGTYLKITLLFAVLTGLLLAVGYLVGLYFSGDPVPVMGLALGLAAVFNFVSYYYSDTFVLRMSKAKVIQESDNPMLFRIVRNVAEKAQIPMPKVGIVDSSQPNAFATGRGPNRAVVCATSGILQTLTPDELEAVIGHEIGHVVHRDVLMSSVAATMAGAISYIGTIAMWSLWLGGGSGRNRGGGSPIPLLVAAILVPLGATFIQLGISRSDEYNADEYGAKLTRNPGGLIRALEKISTKAQTRPIASRPGASPSPATASLWIVNPFRGSSMVELFSTHPSMPHRIWRLKRVARELNMYVP